MADIDPQTFQILVVVLIGVAVAGLAYALAMPYLSGEKQAEQRLKSVTESKASRVARTVQATETANRRKAVADTLKEIEERQAAKEKGDPAPSVAACGSRHDAEGLLDRQCHNGHRRRSRHVLRYAKYAARLATAAAAFIGALSVSRAGSWARLTKRRQAKFLDEFANAIDVIVRGVKSGLPLNECLGIIARESPSPIREEFSEVVDQQRVGVPLSDCFDRMMARMPLPEVKFFAIVIGIQQQAGGNLSEASGQPVERSA